MLYIGKNLNRLNLILLLILEGTKFTANNQPNAFSVIAVANKGDLLSAPDTYMEKSMGEIFRSINIDNGLKKILNYLKQK